MTGTVKGWEVSDYLWADKERDVLMQGDCQAKKQGLWEAANTQAAQRLTGT